MEGDVENSPSHISYEFGRLKDPDQEQESTANKEAECNYNTINSVSSSKFGSVHSLFSAKLSWKIKFFYSLGHIYNDLVVSIWFSYTLLFFKFQFPGSLAGSLILLGQITDALVSPFVGYESDKSSYMWLCQKYGRRKTWHLIGTIMNTVSIPFVYSESFKNTSEWSRFFYYGMFVVIFQAGWAAVQVSHVSLIVDLTIHTSERIALNAYRQAATIVANIFLYTITLLVIGFEDNGTIQQKDLVIFSRVSYIVCAIGLAFSLLFQIFVHEPEHEPQPRHIRPSIFTTETKQYLQQTRGSLGVIAFMANNTDQVTIGSRKSSKVSSIGGLTILGLHKNNAKRWHDWFKSVSFWKITLMYTLARMLFNITQVYTPLYLQDFLQLRKQNIAIIPFAIYFSGLIASFIAKPLSARLGTRVTLGCGCIFGVITSVCFYLGTDSTYKTYQIYIVSAFLGMSGTAMIIASLSLTSDLIGGNTTSSAFVFASMSFFDKSINGLVIALLEKFKPEYAAADVPNIYYKNIMISLTGIPSILIFLTLLTIIKTDYGRYRPRANSLISAVVKQ